MSRAKRHRKIQARAKANRRLDRQIEMAREVSQNIEKFFDVVGPLMEILDPSVKDFITNVAPSLLTDI